MKSTGLFIFSFLIGIGLVFGYLKLKVNDTPQQKTVAKKQISTTPTFSIETPPSESLKGSIVSKTGIIFWESRIATAPSELKENVQIQQGEELLTHEKSGITVNFDQVGTIVLSENADLSFIQTLPVDFVVEQKNGTIKYTMNGKTPLSIKIRSALITKTSGEIQITATDGDPIVLISTLQGTAKIGFNDLDYVSQVFTLREGQMYEYNSDERTAINSELVPR